MKFKTERLLGDQLDWAVAVALGEEFQTESGYWPCCWTSQSELVHFKPSTDWAHGGPIIEQESIGLGQSGYGWIAALDRPSDGKEFNGDGLTPLIAAMRCFVASKLGDEIDVPEALC